MTERAIGCLDKATHEHKLIKFVDLGGGALLCMQYTVISIVDVY